MIRFTADSLDMVPESLVRSPLLEGVLIAERNVFFRSLRTMRVDAGTCLYAQGDPGDTLYIVVDGEVTMTHLTGADEEVELDRAAEGDVFGEMAVLSPSSRAATATTTMATDLLILTRSQFKRLLEAREPCSEALLRYATRRICRRLREMDARIDLAHEVAP